MGMRNGIENENWDGRLGLGIRIGDRKLGMEIQMGNWDWGLGLEFGIRDQNFGLGTRIGHWGLEFEIST